MRVGIFTDTFFPEINGVATSVMLLQRELEKRGHSVYVVTSSHPQLKGEEDIPNTFRLPSAPFVFLPSRRMAVVYNKRVAHKIQSLNLDIVHTNTEFSLGMFGKLSAAVLNKPVLHTFHTLYEDYVHYITRGHFKNFSAEMAKLFSKTYCNSCDAIVVPTDKTRDMLLQYNVDRPISIIPTGIDIEPFRRREEDKREIREIKKKFHIREDEKVILYVGRLAKEKNIDTIVENLPPYFHKNPKTKFLIVGDGPWKKEIENMANRQGIGSHVVFAGEQPWKDISTFYKLGDVFVSASLSETQGLTFIEAMAAGIPVLAKKDRSIEKLIFDDFSGSIFEDDNDIPLKLQRILGDAGFAGKLAKNGIEIAEQNSSAQFAQSIEQSYEVVIKAWIDSGKRHKLNKKLIQKLIM